MFGSCLPLEKGDIHQCRKSDYDPIPLLSPPKQREHSKLGRHLKWRFETFFEASENATADRIL
jgi:hypothetical protein